MARHPLGDVRLSIRRGKTKFGNLVLERQNLNPVDKIAGELTPVGNFLAPATLGTQIIFQDSMIFLGRVIAPTNFNCFQPLLLCQSINIILYHSLQQHHPILGQNKHHDNDGIQQ